MVRDLAEVGQAAAAAAAVVAVTAAATALAAAAAAVVAVTAAATALDSEVRAAQVQEPTVRAVAILGVLRVSLLGQPKVVAEQAHQETQPIDQREVRYVQCGPLVAAGFVRLCKDLQVPSLAMGRLESETPRQRAQTQRLLPDFNWVSANSSPRIAIR